MRSAVLGTYSFGAGGIEVIGFTPTRLDPDMPGTQGNPAYANGFVIWDDEDLPGADRDLYAAPVTGTLPVMTAGTSFTVGASEPGSPEIQPFLDADGATLYYMGASGITSKTITPGTDPSLVVSWSPPTVHLGAAPGGDIVAVGEPTNARSGGTTELYFVYVLSTPDGFDANVGRVRAR